MAIVLDHDFEEEEFERKYAFPIEYVKNWTYIHFLSNIFHFYQTFR